MSSDQSLNVIAQGHFVVPITADGLIQCQQGGREHYFLLVFKFPPPLADRQTRFVQFRGGIFVRLDVGGVMGRIVDAQNALQFPLGRNPSLLEKRIEAQPPGTWVVIDAVIPANAGIQSSKWWLKSAVLNPGPRPTLG